MKAYPLIKVTNIAESIYPVIITDWCANNETDCNPNQHTVTAFRCLGNILFILHLFSITN